MAEAIVQTTLRAVDIGGTRGSGHRHCSQLTWHVDTATGTISGSTISMHFLSARSMTDYFRLPVNFQNDANCVALAESWLGNASDVTFTVLMIVGIGIGGGLSARAAVITEIRHHVSTRQERHSAQAIQTEIEPCKYLNDADLIDAVRQFEQGQGVVH